MSDQESTPAAESGDAQRALVSIDKAPITHKTLQYISRTELVPGALRGKPEAMLAAVLAGREFGLGPMASMRQIDVIDGNVVPSAELLTALVRRAGHRIRPKVISSERAIAIGERVVNGEVVESMEFEFTWDDANRVVASRDGKKLTDKANWKHYPQFMLWWRAVSGLCRIFFPDVVAGFGYTADEYGDEDWKPPAPTDQATGDRWVMKDGELEIERADDDEPEVVEAAEPESKPEADEDAQLVEDEDGPAMDPSPPSEPDAGPEPTSTAEAVENVKAEMPGSEVVDPGDLWKELHHLVGETDWRPMTAEELKDNTRKLFTLMAALDLWKDDAYHVALARFGQTNGDFQADPRIEKHQLEHWSDLRFKAHMQHFAAQCLEGAKRRIEKYAREEE